jgi:hypothetical protein
MPELVNRMDENGSGNGPGQGQPGGKWHGDFALVVFRRVCYVIFSQIHSFL